MAKKFDALYRLGQIDEGRLTEALDAELQAGIQTLLKHRREHGQEGTKKAKAEITLKLTVRPGAAEDTYLIRSSFKRVLPGRPDTESFAVQEYDEGKPVLIVQSGLATNDDPRQRKLDLGGPAVEAPDDLPPSKRKGA